MSKKEIDVLILVLLAIIGLLYANFTKDMFVGKAAIAGIVYIVPSIIYLGLRKKKKYTAVITIFLTNFGRVIPNNNGGIIAAIPI